MPLPANRDIDTLPVVTDSVPLTAARSPCLTVLTHGVPEMIGARAFLPQLERGEVVGLARLTPQFTPLAGPDDVLGDPYVSRQPILMSWRDGVVLAPPAADSQVVVDGQRLLNPMRVERDALDRGVVIELSHRTALLLHLRTRPEPIASCGMVGGSQALDEVRQQILRAALYQVPVLIVGETGVGKELVARALHEASSCREGPWVAVNVAELQAETAASVLFGHVRGAFTGASHDHDGLFVRADGGTLFLDEIGDMAPDVQAMLLRVLETGEVQRLGDRRVRAVNVRVIAASEHMPESGGALRSPLLYRLAGYTLRVPPLRQRPEDIGTLFRAFCDDELARNGRPRGTAWLPSPVIAQFLAHKWPGNARELRNLARTLVIEAAGEERLGRDFSPSWFKPIAPPTAPQPVAPVDPEESAEDRAVAAALARNHWNLTATARDIGVARSTLYTLIDRSTVLRKAVDVPADELERVWRICGGDVDAMAERLQVSPRGLRLALRSVSWAGPAQP